MKIFYLLSSLLFLITGIINLSNTSLLAWLLPSIASVLFFTSFLVINKNDNKDIQIELSHTVLDNLNIELNKLLSEGKKIKAIQKYRTFTGASLKESEDYINSLS